LENLFKLTHYQITKMLYIIIIILGGIASFFLPWWIVAPVCFGVCFWRSKSGKSAFGIGSAAVSTLWLIYALYLYLTADVDMLLPMTQLISGSGFLSTFPQVLLGFIIMLLIATLVGGFSGLAGYHTGQLTEKE
jgi:ABC-type multidrug transport system fused ATPase/permease subunit